MDPLLHWIRETPLGTAMREVPDLFPACEMAHFIGLSMLMGAMIVIDLRLLGLIRGAPYRAVLKLIPVALAGFAINLLSGIAFIACNPFLYFTNTAFYLKLLVILLGGLNALWFALAEQKTVAGLSNDETAPAPVRIMAGASLILWVLVILLGRLLPTFASAGGG